MHIDNYPYIIRGEVVRGKAIGRRLGMPTANLKVAPGTDIPTHGVYACVATVRGREFTGLTNIGTRPTVDDSPVATVETYLFDFAGDLNGDIYDLNGDIYDETMEISLQKFIREIRKFGSLDELRSQVRQDEIVAREYFRQRQKY